MRNENWLGHKLSVVQLVCCTIVEVCMSKLEEEAPKVVGASSSAGAPTSPMTPQEPQAIEHPPVMHRVPSSKRQHVVPQPLR